MADRRPRSSGLGSQVQASQRLRGSRATRAASRWDCRRGATSGSDPKLAAIDQIVQNSLKYPDFESTCIPWALTARECLRRMGADFIRYVRPDRPGEIRRQCSIRQRRPAPPYPECVRQVLSIAALVLLLSACGTTTADQAREESGALGRATAGSTPVGGQGNSDATATERGVYDFAGTTIEGADFQGASLRGKPAVLWFWAPWCPTCRAQQGVMTSLADTFDGEVSFVGVGGLDEDTDALEDFASQTSGRITHLSDSPGAVWRHFGITEQSMYVVLNGDGEVVAEGVLSDAELEDVVRPLAG